MHAGPSNRGACLPGAPPLTPRGYRSFARGGYTAAMPFPASVRRTILVQFRVLAAAATLTVLAGCGGGGGTGGFVERNPLPADTMQVPTAEPGRYGGRFVAG